MSKIIPVVRKAVLKAIDEEKICNTGCLGRRMNGLPQSLNWYQKALRIKQ